MTSKTWMRPDCPPAAMRLPSERKAAEKATSEKEEMVVLGRKLSELKMVREAEKVAAKSCGGAAEKSMDETAEMRLGICWALKERQYFDSGVEDPPTFLFLGFAFAFTGKCCCKCAIRPQTLTSSSLNSNLLLAICLSR